MITVEAPLCYAQVGTIVQGRELKIQLSTSSDLASKLLNPAQAHLPFDLVKGRAQKSSTCTLAGGV